MKRYPQLPTMRKPKPIKGVRLNAQEKKASKQDSQSDQDATSGHKEVTGRQGQLDGQPAKLDERCGLDLRLTIIPEDSSTAAGKTTTDATGSSSDPQTGTLSTSLAEKEKLLRQIFQNCSDLVFRPIAIHEQTIILLVYIDGLTDVRTLDQAVLEPILYEGSPNGLSRLDDIGKAIARQLVAVAQTRVVSTIIDVVDNILQASVAILVDGETNVLIADMKAWPARAVEEPKDEITIRGPREGFTETLRVNTSMIRRKIKSSRLKMEPLTIGKFSRTSVVIVYIQGIVNQKVLNEVRTRIGRIQIDAILDAHYIEAFIEDFPFSPYPHVQNTERPDVLTSAILEGKVGIIIDGTPFALIVPMTFWAGMQAAEDYYERPIYVTAIRWLRFALLLTSLFLTPTYVAIISFHPQVLPAALIISFAAAREAIPFPTIFEAFMMELMFEGLREAGIRLPSAAGSAVSIVGALVIGQAAVQAGIVSAPMVIVVAASGIASFAIPRYNLGLAKRLMRFPILLLAGFLGVFGIAIGFLALLIHLVKLRSFGVPYLSPVSPRVPESLKDVLIRAPIWALNKRPKLIAGKDSVRIPKGQKPGPER